MSCVCANENTDVLNETQVEDSFNLPDDCKLDNQDLPLTDVDDCKTDNLTSSNQGINITHDNINQYFKRGALRDAYSNTNFFISEDMDDLGILRVIAENVTINGLNHTLKNTVFSIESDGVTLNNLTLIVNETFEDNDYAAVLLWRSDDVKLYNLNINYDVPEDCDAFGIYSEGVYNSFIGRDYRINDLKIVNCTINIKGNNRLNGRVYGVKLEESPRACVLNTTINCELPLRKIDFAGSTAVLDSEFALAVGAEKCDNLVLDNNNIRCSVSERPDWTDPTLDAIFICECDNCNFTNNNVYLCDFITVKDMENYLYALDIYRDNNMLIENNTIRVETTGGRYAAGTAYPIQITGPADGIIIQYNDIYTKSNGPNIGIYSQNSNGGAFITVLNNYINVTGLAGNNSWALVAGIEAQDNDDIVMNNIIEIHNIESTELDDNIYGISYSQKTNSKHTFRVINNTVISDGYYVSYMLDADDTNVTNNTLVRNDKYARTDYDPFKRGDNIGEGTDEAKNNDFSGNRVITIFEYDMARQSTSLDDGEELPYDPPSERGNISNIINGSGISPLKPGFPGGNPLLPGHNGGGSFDTGGNNGGGLRNPEAPDGDRGFHGWGDVSGDDGSSLSGKKRGSSDGNSPNDGDSHRSYGSQGSFTNSYNHQGSSDNSFNNNNLVASENSTSSESPSVEGVTSSGASSSSSSSAGAGGSAGSGGSEDVRAYEISKNIIENGLDDIVRFIVLAIVCEALLIIGYRRRKTDDILD